MRPTSRAQIAALRLMERLPVRTHRAAEPTPEPQWVRKTPIPAWKVREAKRLEGTMSRKKIARAIQVTEIEVTKMLGPAKSWQKQGRKI